MTFRNEFYALIGVLGLLAWLVSFFNLFKKNQLYLPRKFAGSRISFTRFISFIFGFIGWLLITFALMGPREPSSYVESSIEVNDIYLVVDVSGSMLAEDFHPNRLIAAREMVREFIDLKPIDRVGIILFSENVFTLLPLTTDLELMHEMVDDIDINVGGFLGTGTNIGDAIALAVGRLETSLAKNKVIVMFTDGVSNVGILTPMQGTEIAVEKGVRMHTVAIGTDQDARIPVGRNVLGQTQYSTIPGGSFDTDELIQMAEMTGGRFFHGDSGDALNQIMREIDKLERTEIKLQTQVVYTEKYFWYLFSGIVLFLLSEIIRRTMAREVLV